MRVLLDHNVPRYLNPLLLNASSANGEGWHELANGTLLAAAEQAGFSVLLTLDRGFLAQQNLVGRSIANAVLAPADQSREAMTAVATKLAGLISPLGAGTAVLIG
ncbi:MAG: hypothetical protein ACYC96_08620 [Fimbriimonadaceae bacterium]